MHLWYIEDAAMLSIGFAELDILLPSFLLMQFSNVPYQRSLQCEMSNFAYLALFLLVSNLKFHVSNSKKSVFTPLMKAAGEISSAKMPRPLHRSCPFPYLKQALLILLLFCALLCTCLCFLSFAFVLWVYASGSESAWTVALFYLSHIQRVAGGNSAALSQICFWHVTYNALSHSRSPSRRVLSLNDTLSQFESPFSLSLAFAVFIFGYCRCQRQLRFDFSAAWFTCSFVFVLEKAAL